MSVELSDGEKKAFKIYYYNMQLLMKKLQQKNKMNSNYVENSKRLHEIINNVNQGAVYLNRLDLIISKPKIKKKFLKDTKKYDIDSDLINDFWFNLFILNILKNYWLIESSLGILLKGVKYGTKSKEKVKGRETLGDFEGILKKLDVNIHIGWDVIDKNFRNALAHGWFRLHKDKLIYYKNSQLEDPTTLTKPQLIKKYRGIYINTMVISGIIGNWSELVDFGPEDPLRN